MAAIAATQVWIGDHTKLITWSNVTEADTFVMFGGAELADFADRNVQIVGTFGGATVVINGSNNGSTFAPLTDPQGNGISKTTAAIEQITENTLWVQPTHSAGTGESVTVVMLARRSRSGNSN